MPRPSRSYGGEIVAVALVVVVIAVLIVAQVYAPSSRSPQGPQMNPTFDAIVLGLTSTTYVGADIWYNFTVTAAESNLSWNGILFSITPGPLARGESNWTLEVWNASSGLVVPFMPALGNWTCSSAAPLQVGEQVVLKVDSPLVEGYLTALWLTGGGGSDRVSID